MTGGAIAIRADQFKTVNGFSNVFFGWGGEDDEFYQRLADHDLQPVRYHPSLARYVSLRHVKQSQHSNVNIKTAMSQSDGLNSLNYSLHSIQYLSQFTLIQVYLWQWKFRLKINIIAFFLRFLKVFDDVLKIIQKILKDIKVGFRERSAEEKSTELAKSKESSKTKIC